MRCINKRIAGGVLCVLLLLETTACGQLKYSMPYDLNGNVAGISVASEKSTQKAEPFAADLCVVSGDVAVDSIDMSEASAAVLFDVNKEGTLYSKNAHERLYPASLTKTLTALVALENGSPDQMLVASEAVNITESGAQLIGLKAGDTMTLDQALHILLIYSANDVAMLIAENIGGSVEGFVDMMNAEALRIGATNSHFVNPHGLTDEQHYTTAYDLYLILNEAMQYEKFLEIIQKDAYETSYYNRDGSTKDVSIASTNRYVKGQASAPEKISVIGGKTGTTSAAGHCLMLLSKDESGAPYISVILHSSQTDILYQEMTDLLSQIHK